MINTETKTEKEIINAATELFLEKGFASTSTTEIAKKVGCNQALIHYYFRTKERLFEAVFETKFRGFMENILEISKEEAPFEERLQHKIESHFEMMASNPKLPLLFVYELNTNPARRERLREKLGSLPALAFSEFQRELDEEYEAGKIRKTKVVDLLFSIISLNMALFIVGPVMKGISGIQEDYFSGFVSRRKKENVRIILKSLEP